MKKILLLLLAVLLSLSAFSQTYSLGSIDTTNTSIPKYLLSTTNNKQDTVGVVITIKQAQKINTDLEILSLYKGLYSDCDTTVDYLTKTVADYKFANIEANKVINASDSALKIRNLQIENLKQQLIINEDKLAIKDSVIAAKDDIIALDKKDIKKFKKQRNRAIEVACGLGAAVIALLLGHL